MAESPADEILRAAALMRERANAASPGRWQHMCMGSEGCQVINDGHLRKRKHVSFSGRKEWKADHADAEHIASMHPIFAVGVAEWLEAVANGPASGFPLKVARAYLKDAAQAAGTEER